MIFATSLACRDPGSPDAVARAFVDAYYVEYDVDRALTLAEGAARARLGSEKSLVDEARQKVEVAQARSRTYYEAPTRRDVGPDMVHYTFPLEVKEGTGTIPRTAVVMLARREGQWRVLEFREATPGAPVDAAEGDDRATGGGDSNGVRTSTRADSVLRRSAFSEPTFTS